jgi:prepilin-type N-terminal cleavage/methylation domain-containing protein
MSTREYKKGFSLIELLVVIAIIGVLTAILVLNFDESRKNSRDKVRKSDLKALQLALETYKAQNGAYPPQLSGNCTVTDGTTWTGPGPQPNWGTNCADYIGGLVPDYIGALPTDPNQEGDVGKGYIYKTNADHSAYKVIVHESVETQLIAAQSDEFSRMPEMCGISSGNLLPKQYAIYSPGAECW